jgi:hypothetical protein
MVGETLPDILILNAIAPELHGERLVSPNLARLTAEYDRHECAMWHSYLEADPDGVLEGALAHKLADYYHAKTSLALQRSPVEREMWTNRFNQAGEEIYGTIDPHVLAQSAYESLANDSNGFKNDAILNAVYSKLSESYIPAPESNVEPIELGAFRGALFERFSNLIELVEHLPEGQFKPTEVRELFTSVIEVLSRDNTAWHDWKVTNPPGKTMLSIVPENKEIEVPDGRVPIESKNELLGLLLHEIGNHALRSFEGYELGDLVLAKRGLPDCLDFEEGLGVFFEYLIPDKKHEIIVDRYIDIALASGTVDGLILSRTELINLGIRRKVARANARSQKFDEITASKEVTGQVNRIFRGGDGLPVRDEMGNITTQAVFNKDLVYYVGFLKAKNYVLDRLQAGHSPGVILKYLLSGKFDPTNPKHVEYLAQTHSIEL